MIYLVIPDVHEELGRLNAALQHSRKAEQTIFLGDWFDSFRQKQARETAEWLREHLLDDDKIFLLGNHDAHYLLDNTGFRCSGFKLDKKIVITAVLPERALRQQFKLFHHDNGFLFAHAGVHPTNFRSIGDLINLERHVLHIAHAGGYHPFLGAGYSRGGPEPVGGVNWLDWNYEFEPVDGLYQIVGHTYGGWKTKKPGGMCIDNGLHSVWLVDTESGEKEEIQL